MRTLFLSFLICATLTSRAQFVTGEILQGQWSLEKIWHAADYPGLVEEETPRLPDDNIWIFGGDSLVRFNYPFYFIANDHFTLDSGRLYLHTKRWPFATCSIDSGKLVVGVSDGVMMRFRRDTFDVNTSRLLNTLRRDTINAGLLTENYYMVTHFVPDDAEAYDFQPPVKMPNKISLSDTTDALTMIRTDKIYLKAGRKKRAFYVARIEWDDTFYAHRSEFVSVTVPVLILWPGEWWTGEPFQVVYRANEKEMAHKKR